MKRVTALLMAVMLLFTGCGKNNLPYTGTGFCFDTVVTFSFYGKNAPEAVKECLAMGNHYDDLWNKNKAGSDVSLINRSKGTPVEISAETAELIELALDMAKRSEGAVSPLIGRVSSLWDFKSDPPALPDENELNEALKHIDPFGINVSGNLVTLADPEASLDLGFIAKGYAADMMKKKAMAMGITSGFINLGGNVLVIGSKPDGSDFNIGIKDPSLSSDEPLLSVFVTDESVVTSGVYERCFFIDDTLYFHILDTKTGYPVRNNLLSVTVMGPSSALCDALSTTLFIMGYEDGSSFLTGFEGYKAIFVTDEGDILKTY
ncbi:MAG: FAD:protein FMN transferase [Lachnospiraceae bacterium]|nr:FAD:protein FMN transferase [Lachnospiraceae bacterium]